MGFHTFKEPAKDALADAGRTFTRAREALDTVNGLGPASLVKSLTVGFQANQIIDTVTLLGPLALTLEANPQDYDMKVQVIAYTTLANVQLDYLEMTLQNLI